MNTKTCTLCKKSFSLENFYYTKKSNSYIARCKNCECIRRNKYKSENKEKVTLMFNRYINTERAFTRETILGIFRRAKKNKSTQTRKKWIPECTSEEIFAELELYIKEHGRICEYCKEPWTHKRRMGTHGEGFKKRGSSINTNFSLDRLDSTKTYMVTDPALNKVSNLVFCCIGCNNRKNQVTLSDINNIKRVWRERNEVE